MVGATLRSRHYMIHREIAEREVDPASAAVSFLLAIENVTMRSVRRWLALVGTAGNVGSSDDLAEDAVLILEPPINECHGQR